MSVFYRNGGVKEFWEATPVTSIIIIINTVLFLFTVLFGSFTAANWLLFNGAIIPASVLLFNEWWRIVTAGFLHFGFLHFFGNVIIGLVALSSALERLIGSKKFAYVYFGSLLLSGLTVVFFSGDLTITAGASGAIFGVLGAFFYIILYRKDLLSQRDIDSLKALIVINVLFTLLPAASGLLLGTGTNVSVAGHIGGIISGFLLSFLIIPRTPEPEVIESWEDPFNNDQWYS